MFNNMMNNNQMIQNNNQNIKHSDDNFKKELELDDETYILKIKKIKPSRISIKCENKFDYLSLHYYSINLSYEEFCKLARTFRLFDNIDEIFDTIKNLIKGINYSFKNDREGNQQQMMNPQINNQQMMSPQINNQQMRFSQIKNQQMMNPKINNQLMRNSQMNQPQMMQQQINPLLNNNSLNNRFDDVEEQNVKLERSENDSINLILKIPLLNEKYEKIKIEFKKENRDLKQQFEKMKEKFLKIKKIAFSNETPIITMNNNFNNMSNMQMMNFNSNNQRQTKSAETILSQIKNEFLNNS